MSEIKAPNCAHALIEDPAAWHWNEQGHSPCGACGQWMAPFRLVDVRAHLLPGLRPFSFLCDGCTSRLIRPGRKALRAGVKPVKKSVFMRGLSGSLSTRLAHALRARVKVEDRPELEHLP